MGRSFIFLTLLLPSFIVFGHQPEEIQVAELDRYLTMSVKELMDLEVTIATNTKQTVAKASSVVTVITSDDIKSTGSTNLAEILETVPGIHVRANQFGYRPLIHFRGVNANQTLLMVNGVPMRDLMWGFGIFWKGLPTSMIDRIEIIRGPGSSLFGADASAGVINVITKTAGKITETEVGLRSGSYDTHTGWAQYGGNWKGFDIGLTMELYDTDAYAPYIAADGQTRQDLANDTDYSLAPGHAHFGWQNQDVRLSMSKEHWKVLMDYAQRNDIQTGITGGGMLDPVTSGQDSRFGLDLLYNNDDFRENWGIDAELRYQHLDYSSGDGFQERPPGVFGDDNPAPEINQMRSAERHATVEVSGLYTGIDRHALRLGTGYTWQDLYYVAQYVNTTTDEDGNVIPVDGMIDLSDTTYAFAPEKARTIRHLFVQDIFKLNENWELTAGLRYDHYSDFGNTYNPRVALVWNTTEKLTTKLLYGRAFRPPSFQELYSITANALPNSDLGPERSETLELALTYMWSNDLSFGLNLFQYHQTDIIARVLPPGESAWTFDNIGEHTVHGIELEAKWQPVKTIQLAGNYTYRTQDNTAYRAVTEPAQDAYVRFDWAFKPKWNWNVQANWIADRTRRDADSRPDMDDYVVTDTTLRYTSGKNWEMAASVRNLFDVEAREFTGGAIPDDLQLPERNGYLEVRYKF